jgi:hypothetical protein
MTVHDLKEIGGERSVVAQTSTTTAWEAAVGAVLYAGLGSTGIIEELIVRHVDVAGGADEDVGVYISSILGADDAYTVTVYIHFTRDVNDALGTYSILAPGIRDLPIRYDGVRVDNRPGADGTGGKADKLT